jgi:hypothetical protein
MDPTDPHPDPDPQHRNFSYPSNECPTEHGEEDPPGPEDVGEPVHHVGEELVRQALDRLVRIVEVDQQDLRVVLQLSFSLIKQRKFLFGKITGMKKSSLKRYRTIFSTSPAYANFVW